MNKSIRKIPGWIATGLITILNSLWLFWGFGEAFYEGWGVPETPWFLFLSIALIAMILSVLAIKFPYWGGGILVAAGVAFALWWLLPGIRSGFYTLRLTFGRLLLSGGFAIVGILFILDGKYNKTDLTQSQSWIVKNLRLLFALGLPSLVGIGIAAYNLPIVLTRIDDGDRSARLIQGNVVSLIWAPAGPGWNWKQDFGGYPSWDALATYGLTKFGESSDVTNEEHASEGTMQSYGLCSFLDEAGKILLEDPQYIWRMPTVDEIARSLSIHNINSGCSWNGEIGRLACQKNPDKETPLWAPDEPPVYYWASDQYDEENAYYVSYTGYISYQPKDWGNPRHGYRCVKEP